MVDIVSAISLAKDAAHGGGWAIETAKDWVKGRDPSSEMHAAELKYYAELTPLLEHRLSELEDSDQNRKRLDELLGDELLFILRNYELENKREATMKRRIMLAYATAGSLRLELTIAQIARVERTLRELDPEDIRVLALVHRNKDPAEPVIPRDREHHRRDLLDGWKADIAKTASGRYSIWKDLRPAGEILLPSGCITLEPSTANVTFGQSTGVYVTSLGRSVLAILDKYISDEEGLDR